MGADDDESDAMDDTDPQTWEVFPDQTTNPQVEPEPEKSSTDDVTMDTLETPTNTKDPLTATTESLEKSQPPTLRKIAEDHLASSPSLSSMIGEGGQTTPLPSSPWVTSPIDDGSTSQVSPRLPPNMRISFRYENDSNSSAGDRIPNKWPSSLRVEGEEDFDDQDDTLSDNTGDSGLSQSRGSSSDRPPPEEEGATYRSPSPGTIRPQMNTYPGHKGTGTDSLTAVETTAAGDNAQINNFIDVNNINDTFSGLSSDTSDNDSVVSVIENENAAKTKTDAAAAIELYLKNKNSSDYKTYLKALDLERRAYEITKKLADPANAAQVDAERRRNEELQRLYNRDGSKMGMVWCGDLPRRRNSLPSSSTRPSAEARPSPSAADDDGFTPVQSRRKKRTAQFSSSPEDDIKSKKRHLKKRSRSMRTQRTEVSNFFEALANSSINQTSSQTMETDPLAQSRTLEEGEVLAGDNTVELSSDEDKEKNQEKEPEVVDIVSDPDTNLEAPASRQNAGEEPSAGQNQEAGGKPPASQ